MDIEVNNKVVGYIVKGTYITNRDKSRHYFRKFEGWGISEEVLERLIKFGVTRIIIREQVDHLYDIADFLNGHIWEDNGDKQYIAGKKIPKPKVRDWSKGF